MNRPMSVVCLVVLVACAACGRQGAPTADADNPLPDRYQANLLASTAPVARPGSITATYLGTSTLLIDDGATQLLFDPVLSRPATPSNPKPRIDTARIDDTITQLRADRIKAIFVSQPSNRLGDATYIARKTGATLYGPAAAMDIARADGLPEHQLATHAPGSTVKVGKFRVQQFASRAAPTKGTNGGPRGGGASSDFLITKGSKSLLVKSSANFIPDALDHVNADVVFLATGHLAEQTPFFQDLYYRQTIGHVRPNLVIPLQWEDATKPVSRALEPSEGTPAAFDFLSARLEQDKIKFGLLQGFQTTELFDAKSCAVPMTPEVQATSEVR